MITYPWVDYLKRMNRTLIVEHQKDTVIAVRSANPFEAAHFEITILQAALKSDLLGPMKRTPSNWKS